MSALELEAHLGLKILEPEIFERALTHSSLSQKHKQHLPADYDDNYERLEFLGDAVLALLVSEWLFGHRPHLSEGAMSKLRASLVNEGSLAQAARRIPLGPFLKLSKGEELSGGRDKDSVLANAFEALLAALYLDQGLGTCRTFIRRYLEPAYIAQFKAPTAEYDWKTILQEWTQGQQISPPLYHITSQEGPPHQPTFKVNVEVAGKVCGHGVGVSKKRASQAAAREALSVLTGPIPHPSGALSP